MESTSQGPGSDPPVEGKSSTSLTPTVAPASVAGTPTLKDEGIVGTESTHDSDSANRVNSHGHVASTPSFSYNVPPNASINSESPHPSSSTAMVNSPGSSSLPRPPVPASSGPSFSYNIPQADIVSFQSTMVADSAKSEAPKNVSTSATSLQPPVSGHPTHPGSFMQGMNTQVRPPPSSVAVPREVASDAANFSYNGNHQLLQKDQSNVTGPTVSPATSVPHPVSQHAYSPLGAASSNPNTASPPFRMPPGPPFQPPPGVPRTPVTPQQPFYGTYASNPPMVGPPQGVWLQSPPIGSLSRPQLLPYPPAFPGPFPLSAQRTPLPLVQPSNAQPPSTSIGVSGSVAQELPPGTYNNKHLNAVGVKEESVAGDLLDAWSAHRTETGTIYYYNAVTGQSTYQKPVGFKGEPDKVFAQPTPISWEKCAGTDWSLVTTNDGKRYYYNAKTKLSSWQIPADVAELRKKQESDALKEQSISVQNVTTLTEKGSGPLSLNAPAITTGGRDAISPVSSSALDLIKKKLQDSAAPATTESDLNGSTPVDQAGKGPHGENGKDKVKDDNGDGNVSNSSSDSDDVDTGPTKEERAIQFKEMLKERGVAPFSKWEKELPKFVFDPRFKAIPSYSARRAIFDHFVRTRAEEERKEKRAAQKAAIEGYKQLLDEAKEDITHNTDYQTFKRKWGHDPRFEALDRKEREALLNERVIPLKRSVEEEARAKRAAIVSSFKSMLRENKDISSTSRWSKVKDMFRNDPRYKSVKHEDREDIFNEYISELKESGVEAERAAKAKRDEEEKLKERERVLRKRKEREEQEVERVRSKALRKEAIESYQALLVETIKDPQISWMDAKPKLEKDPQGRAANPYLDQSDLEKLFREHTKLLHDRCANEYKALLAEVITTDAATKEYEDGKTVFTSWSTARHLLKDDTRYNKMPRKDREPLWRRHVEDLQRRRKSTVDQDMEKHGDGKTASLVDSRKHLSGYKRSHDRR
ncbi:putative WW domain, FF domain, WW domain superfamily, FF domain superfamily protein [Helianthus annuus]|uniref:WW domain, FF domain, WW domain superfamily, FF domain superfamily protein n=2 Tax=Helianthus annuus TaxID=4232 RepID=A0A9K3GTW7_HELAN|nr:putative WW domain, FF domain, WW domain superfamily, FF domain superfamily protein [Helianthus annuus]KAJ0635300.1 putative WW domain, FF domain, WW domain superfamily, FF domain superfamily protein [Helianthus annuus]KAJ0811986.1 putative WW domain, FF domain, WW domain superfamily, FF domain superfamily protein [Helianthus annuus]